MGSVIVREGTVDVLVRPLQEADLDDAQRVFRLAFGTFFGAPDPATYRMDDNRVHTRWLAAPSAALGAELGAQLVGSNFVANWGSVGFFGPLTVHPDFWDRGIAQRLLEPTMDLFRAWGTGHAGLFTFAHSPKHVGLYQKFGFWPRFLTALMAVPTRAGPPVPESSRYSDLSQGERNACLAACSELTGSLYEGLDVQVEIRGVSAQSTGDTVLLWSGSRLVGLAVCHCGAGTEAGNDKCYVKFGAVRAGPRAPEHFERLLDGVNALAADRGLSSIVAGQNAGREEAYRLMLARGFRSEMQGVAMYRPNEPGYSRPGLYVIDDWR